MSYYRADEVLPKELLEAVQEYAAGQLLYVPCRVKQGWGSGTSAKAFFGERNQKLFSAYQNGVDAIELARRFSLSVKSVQRIVREMKQQTKKQ